MPDTKRKDMTNEIIELLKRLAVENNNRGSQSTESRRIRRELQSLRHYGGLSKSRNRKATENPT